VGQPAVVIVADCRRELVEAGVLRGASSSPFTERFDRGAGDHGVAWWSRLVR